ncbi:hypothetical protein E3P92_00713 [Wallemia ichthyophaga]|uniref:Uncharacterized protein n=1 Tax=Wallemia ichthyophaga TaxID=245174 RepID=A0A4T0JJY3_WALIC|nr:hypothetical protein E3P90_01369 [Wallemia ichthyophaga]TIB15956.1 hypothetical protein E3P93_01120 [Wallemia ichthyophaga]TIB18207.1 hypothetical protein E3P92_00713 [Wallemia ichthyophaga]TIB19811.1 hypothetical protein E3P89_03618 [Wallemia ichthyophaga]TIB25902.1 hypothetical protein E3P88_01324 [Wallemia ichthyophaga]
MQSALEESLKYVEKLQSLSVKQEVAEQPDSVPFYKASNKDDEDQDWSMLVDDNGMINDDDFDFFDESPKTATTQQTPITPFTPATPTLNYSFIDHSLDNFSLQPTNSVIPNGFQRLAFNRPTRLVNYSNHGKYAVEEGMLPAASFPPLWYESLSRPHLEKRNKEKKDTRRKLIKRNPSASPSSTEEEFDDEPVYNSSDEEFQFDTNQFPSLPLKLHSNGSRGTRDSRGSDMVFESNTNEYSIEARLAISECRWSTLENLPARKYIPGDVSSKDLIPPKFALGYDDQVIHTAPVGISYWEKAGFAPFGGRKDIMIALSTNTSTEIDTKLLHEFSQAFCDIYAFCNLGRTRIIDSEKLRKEIVPTGFYVVRLDIARNFQSSLHLSRATQAALADEVYQVLDEEKIKDIIKSRDCARSFAIRIYEKISLPVQKWTSGNHESNEIAVNFEFPAFTVARNVIPQEQIDITDDKSSAFNNARKLHIAYHCFEDTVLVAAIDEYAHFSDVQILRRSERTMGETIYSYWKTFELQSSIKWSLRLVTSPDISSDEVEGGFFISNFIKVTDKYTEWGLNKPDEMLHSYTYDILEGRHSKKTEYGTEHDARYCTIGIGENRVLKVKEITSASTKNNPDASLSNVADFESYIQSLHNLTFITKHKTHPAQRFHLPFHLHKLFSISQSEISD